MQVEFHANVVDQSFLQVADALRPILETISTDLEGNYGGVMEHLWIDIELTEHFSKEDGSSRYPFRFQKRVSGQSPPFGLPKMPDRFNVGHFSVRPDFQSLVMMQDKQAIPYLLSLIYRGTEVLRAKSKKLGGFDADLFRASFLKASLTLGYDLTEC
jgi:hypothetical protein